MNMILMIEVYHKGPDLVIIAMLFPLTNLINSYLYIYDVGHLFHQYLLHCFQNN